MGGSFSSTWTQSFPPKPIFTEKDVPDLKEKVYIVTGSNTGVGKELACMLYSKNAKVYIAARSEEKAKTAIADIKKASPDSSGSMDFLRLDLADLTTIKASADNFLSKEKKLHVLFNNAGIQSSDPGVTAQGYEAHLGVNSLGTFMFTKLLTPKLVETAKSEPAATVRVIWVSSSGAEILGEKSVGIDLDNLDYHIDKSEMYKYAISKVGNYLHGVEYAKKHRSDGVVSIPLNPGNLQSDLYRDRTSFLFRFMIRYMMYPPIMGAYTELYAGLSPDITLDKTGSWVIPFGRIHPIRKDLTEATRTESEGGNGTGLKFWQWSETEVNRYL
ncbi:hypothetical protein LCI18_003825 [Fusarium solani-melongenae]|uniref:Uncharacterized protein n=1 Tax=Fusarium solani subsp. cucurbitae TaxID=2747967 RepID=A0ACD3YVH5_FUSSC|nr:hypothetical protein LCI18_003825 [Fusarium solani-melongenae]